MLFSELLRYISNGTSLLFPGNLYNTISSGALKFYVGFQKVTSEPLEHSDFVYPQGRSWISTYQNQDNLDHLQMQIYQSQP